MSWFGFCEINYVCKAYKDAKLVDLHSNTLPAKAFINETFSMLLVGDPGTGKTYFMYAMIYELFAHNKCHLHEVRFINGKHLGDMFEEEFRAYGTSRETVRKMVDPRILFVDDFGVEGKSDRIERNYYDLIDVRLADDKPTIFSTNLTDAEIKEIFGARIDSRLKQCVKITFDSKDQRKAKHTF
jgi:DNA replication protein DnaC